MYDLRVERSMRASFEMLNKCYVLNKSVCVFQFMYAMYQQ